MRKRWIFPVAAAAILLSLSGCSAIDNRLQQQYLERSDITADEDYKEYLAYEEAGVLDEEGYYAGGDVSDETEEELEAAAGSIHVTFAENRSFQIYYYRDEERTDRIDTTACYLNPGDEIYASETIRVNNSSLYRLAEFRIIEYDSAGNRKSVIRQESSEDSLVYRIPDNFTGAELEILPVGEYPERQITMTAYYTDDEGEIHILTGAGQWSVNGKDCSEGTASLSALEAYTVKFDYDEENYFYVTASPAAFTEHPETVGMVEFWEAEPTDESVEYSVEIHAYLSLSIKFESSGTVRVNDEAEEKIAKGKMWKGEKLQYGDVIVIETEGDCVITSGDYQHVQAEKKEILDGFRYQLRMTPECEDSDAEGLLQNIAVNRTVTVTLNPSGNYGNCTYSLDGEEVNGTVTLREGQTLEATYQITESGYCFPRRNRLLNRIMKKTKETTAIPISMNLNDQTIYPDDWFEIEEE